jgi:hypothetical protein
MPFPLSSLTNSTSHSSSETPFARTPNTAAICGRHPPWRRVDDGSLQPYNTIADGPIERTAVCERALRPRPRVCALDANVSFPPVATILSVTHLRQSSLRCHPRRVSAIPRSHRTLGTGHNHSPSIRESALCLGLNGFRWLRSTPDHRNPVSLRTQTVVCP